MKRYQRIVAVFLAVVMLLGPHWPMFIQTLYAQPAHINPPRTGIGLKALKDQLMAVTTDTTDTDGDGIPDSVEVILGTDPNNADSDFDKLDDLWEIDHDLDPMEPDSNFDGLPDYLEVTDVPSLDIDGDGIPNAWDYDNDGDGVNDSVDLSPSAKTESNSVFHFDITGDGKPAFITMQLKPSHPEYLRLYGQFWDWPDNDRQGAVQDWDNSKDDVAIFPVLQMSVNVPPTQAEVLLNGIIVEGNTISVPLVPITEHGNTVAFGARIPYPSTTPQNLTMDARLIWKVICYNDPNSSTLGEPTVLATYPDSFSLTGMTIEQSEGADAGIFYSSDINQTVAANLLMAYQFLRNSDNHLADMPAILDANNVDIEQQMATFTHREEAMVSLSNQMIPDALHSLPADANLPVITLLEDSTASVDLSEFNPTLGNSFTVDITAQPIMTTKTLKTNWYNTSGTQAMETGDMMVNISKLGLSEGATQVLASLMLCWNTGEQSMDGLGLPRTNPGSDFIIVPNIAENIMGGGLSGLEILFRSRVGLVGLKSYNFLKLLQSKGLPMVAGLGGDIAQIAKASSWNKFKFWVKQCSSLKENSKLFKRIDKTLDGLDIATTLLDTGFAIYSIIAISQMNDLQGIALYNATMQVTLQYYIDCMFFMVNMIPYVGWLLALAAELGDVFGSWSNKAVAAIVGAISDVDFYVTPSIAIVGDPWITLTDKDNNGMDVGDRIEYKSRLKSTIQGSGSAYSSWETMWGGRETGWGLINSSEMYPYYKIYGPAGSNSLTGYCYQQTLNNVSVPINPSSWTYSSNINAAWKSCEYESGVWIEPGKGMVNFPVYIELNSTYDLYYLWSWYSFVFWDWGWQYVPDDNKGSLVHGGDTFYVDVMPGTLEDFVNWKGITRLDSDGDGLLNSQEPTNYWGELLSQSNPWLYDTDSDGLNDKFEIDNGLDPKDFDTDGDGLADWYEIQFGTDPLNPDTDGDGLTDYLEIAGWMIQFEYAGQTFTTRVYSDPTTPDTDGDGVNDYQEYFSGLNPRSHDTNGDGINDIAKPQGPGMTVEFVKSVSFEERANASTDITVDDAGYLYESIADYDSTVGYIRKFDTDLNLLSTWTINNSIAGNLLVDNENKLLYLSHPYDTTPTISGDQKSNIQTLSLLDGSQVGGFWATQNEIEGPVRLPLARDTSGNFYVARSAYWYHYRLNPPVWVNGVVSLIDVYDSNKNHINRWGAFAANGELDKFACIKDIAYNPVNGLLYICDGYVGGMSVNRDDRIAVFTTDGQYQGYLPGYHKDDVNFEYQSLSSVAIDADGYVYICDSGNARIHKVDPQGVGIASWDADGENVVVDKNKNVFVLEEHGGDYAWILINKFRQVMTDANEPTVVADTNPDRDGDGLTNDVETAGWNVTFTDPNGTHTIAVTSDPLLADTDLDGLTDLQEQQLGTNPRNPDTDGDGVSDFAEIQAQTDPKNYDTDGDGLSDGAEVAFGSNPNVADTDGDGLSDKQEFDLGTNPNNPDTDGDGLSDADEIALKANPLSPDTDGDFILDGQEAALGTDPNNSDTDNDGLTDGMEISVYKTNPTNPDTDGDGLADGAEIDLHLDPLSNDTDGDGVPDGKELEDGTNPFSGDTDHDGIPDGQDKNTNLPPDVSKVHPSQEYLWPADNKYVPISIQGITDPDGDTVQIAYVSVTSDEPSSSGHGDKYNFKGRCDKNKTKADAYLSDDGTLYLKAERDGNGNGRVYEVNFMAGDGNGGLTPGKVQVKVPHSKKGNTYKCVDDGQKYEILSFVPNQAPDVSNAYPSKATLWPANRKFEQVTIKGVTDPEGDDVKIIITDITSDEPAAFSKRDLFSPDAYIAGKDMALLRAERADNGNGRVYKISFTAKDSGGKESTGTVQVGVPICKNQPAIDDGQNYDPLSASIRHKFHCFVPDFDKHQNIKNKHR